MTASAKPSVELVESYYDERVGGKLADFTGFNPRIEAAVACIAEWAPANPRRILEIGCSVGHTAWRMARAFPQAEMVGADISPGSIAVAQTCFTLPNLTYRAGIVKSGVLEGKFDLIYMTDVYEHIAAADRPELHKALRELLSDDGRFIITIPTPDLQEAAKDIPGGLQPVDESIGLTELGQIASDIEAEMLYFRRVGIWEYGDYDHVVFGRYERLAKVGLREHPPQPAGLKTAVKRMIGRGQPDYSGRFDYLGSDVGRPAARDTFSRFSVPAEERQRLASAWTRKAPSR